MTRPWSDTVAAQLLNTEICPRCDNRSVTGGWCRSCGADLRSPVAIEVWQASVEAARAVQRRQQAIDRLPTAARAPLPATSAPAPVSEPAVAVPERASSQVSVQSVLAGAGAGLFAVAAIVFTFFNPDLTDFGTRTAIVAAVTALFLGGAWLLARRGLQFSAESVGALGVVFVGLDVWSFSEGAPEAVSGFALAGVGTVLAALGLLALARLARVRVWLWSSVVGFTITPALLGYAAGNPWVLTTGHLGVVLAGLAVLAVLPRLARPVSAALRPELVTVTTLQIAALVLTTLGALMIPPQNAGWDGLGRAALLGGLALAALLSARSAARPFWSFACGALFTAAASALPFALELADPVWYAALVPVAAALGLAALGVTRIAPAIQARGLRLGAAVVALIGALPALFVAVTQLLTPPIQLLLAWRDRVPARVYNEVVQVDPGLASILGLAAFSAGMWLLYRGVPRAAPPAGAATNVEGAGRQREGALHPGRVLALWSGALTIVTAAGWAALPGVARIPVALALAALLSVLLFRFRSAPMWSPGSRAPFVTAAHALVLLAGFTSWIDRSLTVPAGAALVAVLVVVASTTSARFRFIYAGAGYAYALVIFATALADGGVDTIPLLCLTTTLASVVALAVTLADWPTVRSWYAVLAVTAVPFLIGVGSVLTVRSGWTALSTAVTFALALALVVTRRPGLTRLLRAAAAALLVPSIAVVIVCLGAQVLAVSASPVTLPLIALVVACVLPSRNLVAAGLRRRGLAEADVRTSVLWIELSSLLTASLAVLLALVREAAGLGTTFLVLLILGLGAAATGFFAHRRYGWWTAGASWTGALWCVWAIAGIDVVEPYLLPPAVAAMVVGFVLTARRSPATGLYSTALFCAVLPSLWILALFGSGDGSGAAAGVAWRAYGVLTGAVLLLALGWAISRRPATSRLHPLSIPTFLGSIVAASAGAVQAVRYGFGRDPLGFANDELAMLPVLGLSIAAALIAASAAKLLLAAPGRLALAKTPLTERWLAQPRWLYVPATIYLVAGPIAAIRPGWFPIWTLWTLALAVLALMLITVARARTGPTTLPPVWFTFLLAWCTAVAGWSERELRVEAFSLPLGLALLGAGILAARGSAEIDAPVRPTATSRALNDWPVGFTGSWWLFAPGIIVTILPSVLATGTDPLTQRAILVIALALAAILIGLLRRLAAPFLLGLVVLPIENVLVFVVQIGRSISAAPWWITLATAGAVLLVIAVGYERRSAQRGVAARLRDLT